MRTIDKQEGNGNQSRQGSTISADDLDRTAGSEPSSEPPEGRPMEPLLLNVGEVATLLGLGRSAIFALLATGELPVVRIGRSVRVPRGALERWIEEHTAYGANRGDVRRPVGRDLGGWRSGA